MDAVEVPGLERNFVYRRAQQDGAWGVSADYTPGLPNTLEDHLSLDVASADSPIVISEASSQNRTYARSADGEYYDYIELYNTSAQPVSLAGYTLTDDPNDLAKYTFPEERPFPRTAIASSTPPAGRTPGGRDARALQAPPPRARACFCAMARAAPSAAWNCPR